MAISALAARTLILATYWSVPAPKVLPLNSRS